MKSQPNMTLLVSSCLPPHRWVLLAVSLSALVACAPLNKALPGSESVPPSAYAPVDRQLKEKNASLPSTEQALPVTQRMPAFDSVQDAGSGQPQLYSFKARQLPLRDALGLLAKAHGLNIVADPEVSGIVSVDFQNVPLSKAFDILLSSLGYSWEDDQGVIRVYSSITRTFEVDYIQAKRSTGAAGGGGGEGAAFWQEFETQIRSLLSPKGRLIVNRLTGTVMVTDLPARVELASRFIGLMREGMYRQVDIEVRIVEVTLSDNFALGLDWSRFQQEAGRDNSIGFNTRITAPQGTSALPSTMTLRMTNPSSYVSLIDALSQQGDVRMVSQPRIRIMNNQTARVKSGTDEAFFVRSSNRVLQNSGGVLETVNEQPQTVSLGVTLSVTPQISADGWAMLNITPSITRLIGTAVSPRGDSTAPILDVSEATTMVRVRSGELVILGGLIQEETSDTNRRVPGLGEVPGLGNLFKSTYKAGRRKELVIFLAPTIQPGQ
jgi:MSHA type pilus biogenesis protein MshL